MRKPEVLAENILKKGYVVDYRAKVKYHSKDDKIGVYGHGGGGPDIYKDYLELVPSEVSVMITAYDVDDKKDRKNIKNWNKKMDISKFLNKTDDNISIKDRDALIRMQQPINILAR